MFQSEGHNDETIFADPSLVLNSQHEDETLSTSFEELERWLSSLCYLLDTDVCYDIVFEMEFDR